MCYNFPGFDYLAWHYPLPLPQYQDVVFMTKHFGDFATNVPAEDLAKGKEFPGYGMIFTSGCHMDYYAVESNGNLYRAKMDWSMALKDWKPHNYGRFERFKTFTDDVYFWNYVRGVWIEFRATFVDGHVEGVELYEETPMEKPPYVSSVMRHWFTCYPKEQA